MIHIPKALFRLGERVAVRDRTGKRIEFYGTIKAFCYSTRLYDIWPDDELGIELNIPERRIERMRVMEAV